MADYKEQGLYQEGNSLFDDIFAFGDLEVQNINVVGIITASKLIGDGSELSGIDATTIKDSTGTTQIQGTTSGATHSGRAVFNEVEIGGKLYDADGDFGTSGQVLASDGTNTNWINSGSLTAGAASEVGVTAVNSNSNHFVTFVDSSSGNENIKVDTNLIYNPNSNLLSLGGISFSGTISGGTSVSATNLSGNLTGTIQTAAQANITSVGTLTGLTVDGNVILDSTSNYLHIKGALYDKDGQSGSNGQVLVSTGSQVDWQNPNTLTASNSLKITITESDTNTAFPITFSAAPGQSGGNTLLSDNQFTYNASSNTVTAGTFSGSGASLTSLNASNLQSGTVADARIPNLNASKITAGTLADARIPNLNASKITAGTLADARLTNTSLFVTGMIMLWYGSVASIPSGWVLCDGNNSTPDLRSRFVVGAGTGGNYSPNDTGGSANAVLVSHTHNLQNHVHGFSATTSNVNLSHNHATTVDNTNLFPSSGQTSIGFGGAGSYPATTFSMSNALGNHAHTVSGNTGTPSTNTTDTLGESATNKNLPPYYALCYIMKT